MSNEQIETLAQDLAELMDVISNFYADPETQKEFEVWLHEKNRQISQ